MNAQHTVFFVPGKPYIHDLLIDRDGALTGKYGGERVSQLWAQHPTGIVTTLQEANAAIDQQATTPPKEITKERFWYLLEVLPPVRWINGEHTESFRVSECITGTVYTAGVRLGERYFELQQPISVTHDQLVALCKAVQA